MFPWNGGIWPRTTAVVAAMALVVGLVPEPANASEASDPAPPAASIGKGALVDGNGVIFPIVEELPGGRIVTTPCAVEIVYEEGRYLDRVDVVLDPGHGGPETGSVGTNGLVERDLNLAVALLAEQELEALGHSVELTRRNDLHMPIRQRAAIANALSPRAFVSIHHNGGALRRSNDPGTETFHQVDSTESRRLAGLLFEEISAAFENYWVPWVATVHRGASTRLKEPGLDAYGVLRYTPSVPAAISEAGYLSNPAEAQLLALPEVQENEAEALARAIDRFLTTDSPGSGFRPAFVDGVMTGTGTGKGCLDPDHGSPDEVLVAYTTGEYAALADAAARQGTTVRDLQVFGVHALDFLRRINGGDVTPLSEDSVPDVRGSIVEVTEWTPTERVALARVADAYGLSPAQAQKLGAVL
ncbi:MAG: N-acetylmuramoyl-L-alanine amidase, partial [Acidimicrobiales bacterium]|nr:N-acetylmuramoyl-L-alanine amidase [Acidimicrobiales bacterium]